MVASHSEKAGSATSGLLLCAATFGSISRGRMLGQYPAEAWSSLVNPGTGEGNGSGYATATGQPITVLPVACRAVLSSSSSSNLRRIVEFQWFFMALSVLYK